MVDRAASWQGSPILPWVVFVCVCVRVCLCVDLGQVYQAHIPTRGQAPSPPKEASAEDREQRKRKNDAAAQQWSRLLAMRPKPAPTPAPATSAQGMPARVFTRETCP